MGAATSGLESCLLMEEGEAASLPSLRQRGNLYLLAHGVQSARLLRALRDQYCGDPAIGGPLDVSLGLLDSLEAGASLLTTRETGVSCLAAVTRAPNRLALVGVGDCRAFLEEGRKGGPKTLLSPRYPHKKLAMEGPGVIERVQRSLEPGDRIFLCCGPLAQVWGLNELSGWSRSQPQASPQDLADQLAGGAEAAGGGAAMVIACRDGGPDLALEHAHYAPKGYEPGLQAVPSAASRRGGGRKLPLSWLLVAFVAVAVGSAATDTLQRYLPPLPPAVPWAAPPAQEAAAKDLWARVDALWPKGQKGEVEAWREAVALLEKLQSAQPGDAGIIERLRAAEQNRMYAEGMVEVARLWGTGETSALRVESWAKAVEVMEGLQARMAGTGFIKSLVEKLYAARVNHGKALEAAGRQAEARASYEKARELDPTRPEAVDALRRLR